MPMQVSNWGLRFLLLAFVLGRSLGAQARVIPQPHPHVVRDSTGFLGGPWHDITSGALPRDSTSGAGFRFAMVPVGITSIVPGGVTRESCQSYAIIVDDGFPKHRRLVYIIGEFREPGDFELQSVTPTVLLLRLAGSDCLTYELAAAGREPVRRQYNVLISMDSVRVSLRGS